MEETIKDTENHESVEGDEVQIGDNMVLRKLLVSWNLWYEMTFWKYCSTWVRGSRVYHITLCFCSISGVRGILIHQTVVGERVSIVARKVMLLRIVQWQSGRNHAMFVVFWDTMQNNVLRYVLLPIFHLFICIWRLLRFALCSCRDKIALYVSKVVTVPETVRRSSQVLPKVLQFA